tara:strand:- start:560 stop:796 length:237 start_codon:yes stop_codon:yes gene_type:complete
MVTPLSKPLSRELTKFQDVIVTLTQTGITLKIKRRHKSIEIPWEVVFGAGAMLKGDNLNVMMRGSHFVLKELGYEEDS